MATLTEHTVNTMVHGFLLDFNELSKHQQEIELNRFVKSVIGLSVEHKPEWLPVSHDTVYEYEPSNVVFMFE